MPNLLKRIEKLERGWFKPLPPDPLTFHMEAIEHWMEADWELLIQASHAKDAGRPLSAAESAVLESYDADLQRACRQAGLTCMEECQQRYEEANPAGHSARPAKK